MNLSQRTSLSLLFVSLSAVPATAALSVDSGSGGVSIETTTNSASLQPLDQLLGGGNDSELFKSVLQQYASAAQPAISTMDGHFGSAGAEKPVVFGRLSPASQTMPPAPSTSPAEAPDLSLTAAVRMGSAQADTAAAVTSPSSPATSAPSVTTNSAGIGDTSTPVTPATPVPLPAAGLLLASGLVGIPAMRKRLRQE